jgi:hypothetical protein
MQTFNSNRLSSSSSSFVLPPTVVQDTPIANPSLFPYTRGQSVYLDSATGVWVSAQSSSLSSFGTHLIKTVAADGSSFSLARSGDVISGFTGLSAGSILHTSATNPGSLEEVFSSSGILSGAAGANPMAYAISATEIIVKDLASYA